MMHANFDHYVGGGRNYLSDNSLFQYTVLTLSSKNNIVYAFVFICCCKIKNRRIYRHCYMDFCKLQMQIAKCELEGKRVGKSDRAIFKSSGAFGAIG